MSARAWSLFTAVGVVWGVPYLFIKLAVDGGMPPFVLAWARIVLAAAILLALARRAGTLDQVRGHWRGMIAYAVIELCIPFPLIAIGEQHVPSSLAAIIVASVPLIVTVLSLRFGSEARPTRRRLAGLFTGLAGVVLLVGLDASGSLSALLGAGAILIAATGYAGGPLILSRLLSGVDPRAAMGTSLAVAGVILTPIVMFEVPARIPTAGAFASVAVLGIVCTALAFVLMAMLIGEIGPSRAVVITYVNPVVAVALGVTLLGERPGPPALAGLVLILAGSWIATDGRLPARFARTGRPAAAGTERTQAGTTT